MLWPLLLLFMLTDCLPGPPSTRQVDDDVEVDDVSPTFSTQTNGRWSTRNELGTSSNFSSACMQGDDGGCEEALAKRARVSASTADFIA